MPAVLPTQWVIGKKFDMIFFLCPIFIGFLYFLSLMLAPTHALLITGIVWVVFAQTHFGSTWFIYFDRKNREHYRKHMLVYYIMPVVIFASVLVLGYFNQTALVILIAVISLYHVAKQNMGILQLYRVRNKEFAVSQRKIENFTVFSWSLFFGVYGALHLQNFLHLLVGPLLMLAWIGCWILFLAALSGSLATLYLYVHRGTHNSLPKSVFLLTSILMYSPYLYASVVLVNIYQMEIATLTSLIAHYMQYIGLVWLININKYGRNTEYAKQNSFLHAISSNYLYIVGAILAYGLIAAYLRWGVPPSYTVLFSVIPNIVAGFMMIHFYIDSFIWRFRDPFVRETVLPFIKPLEPAPAVAQA